MAIITTSGLITGIEGKVQGSIFSNSVSGITVRSQSSTINKESSAQQNHRILSFRLQQEWQNLTEEQRELWAQFVKYKPVQQKNRSNRFINGQQAFIKFNTYRVLYNHEILYSPTFQDVRAKRIYPTFYNYPGIFLIGFGYAVSISYIFIIAAITFELPTSINNFDNRLRLITFNIAFFGIGNLTNSYVNTFGRIPEVGSTIGVKYTTADLATGVILPFVKEKFVVQPIP